MLNKIKIGPKLIGSYVLMACLSISIGLIGISSMNRMDKSDAELYEKATVPMGDFVTIAASFHQSRIMLRDITRSKDESIINKKIALLNGYIDLIEKGSRNVEKTMVTEEGRKVFSEFIDARKQFKEHTDQIVQFAKAYKTAEAYAIIDGPAILTAQAEQRAIDKLIELKLAVAKNMFDQNKSLAEKSASLMIWLQVIGLVIIFIIGFLLIRSITVPLTSMTRIANHIADGAIDEKVEYVSGDEIGNLADSFRKMIANLKGMIEETQVVVKAAGQGNVNARADSDKYKGAFQHLLTDLNTLMDSITKPLQDVLHSLGCVSNNDITAKISNQYPGIWNEIKVSVNTTIERLEHIVSIVNKISRGDMEELDSLKKAGKRSQNDELLPAFVRMIEAIKAISDDVNKLSQAAIEGKLDIRNDVTGHNGDFRKIVNGLNETLDAIMVPINEAMQTLDKVAEKDLTARVNGNYKGDHEKLKRSINITVDNLDKALSQVSQATEQVSSASQQISAGSQSLAQGANEQASSLEEVSSSLEEMASMTKQNAENASQAKILAGEANGNAAQGKQAMARMSDSINKIKESSDQTAKIVKTIDEIAMQTNLLALNAAVEAARAGEAGRGFAVVAEEVRNLAQRSAQAAKNTADMIEESVKNAEEGVVIAGDVAKSFEAIADSNSKVDGLIAEIAAASQEQSQGIDQVNTAVAQMDKVTQQNAANSEESASASEELSSQAEELQSMVGQFALSNNESKSAVKALTQHESVATHHAQHAIGHKTEQPKKSDNGNSGKNGKTLYYHAAKEVDPKLAIPFEEDDMLKEF